MLARGLDRQLVGIGVPSRRMDHGRVDAGFIHLLQQIVLREVGNLSVAGFVGLLLAQMWTCASTTNMACSLLYVLCYS